MFNSVLQNKHLFRNLSLTETPFFLFSRKFGCLYTEMKKEYTERVDKKSTFVTENRYKSALWHI